MRKKERQTESKMEKEGDEAKDMHKKREGERDRGREKDR